MEEDRQLFAFMRQFQLDLFHVNKSYKIMNYHHLITYYISYIILTDGHNTLYHVY